MLTRHGKTAAYVCTCRLTLGGSSVTAKAFVDTGNRLRDGHGSPVAVAERSLALSLLADGLFTGKTPCEKLAVETVNGKSELTVFKIDEVKDVAVAISPRPLAGEYSLILPPAFAKEEDFEERGGE